MLQSFSKIKDQINAIIKAKKGIKALVQGSTLDDIKDIMDYAKNTKNIAHLDFLADFQNYNVLKAMAMNTAIYHGTPSANKVCEKLARICINVPEILCVIAENTNQLKKLGRDISWKKFDDQSQRRAHRIVPQHTTCYLPHTKQEEADKLWEEHEEKKYPTGLMIQVQLVR